jgi:hypothetical protein
MRKGNIIKAAFIKFIFIISLFPLHAFSQDISGVWTGYIYNDTTHKNIHYELAINEPDGKSGGFSHTTFVVDSIKNIGVKTVKIKMKNDHIYIVDNKFIYNNYSEPPRDVVKMYSDLNFSENDSADVLTGTWKTNATKIYNALTGTVFLERKRKEKPEETIIVAKLIELGFKDKLSFLPPLIASKEMVVINNKQNIPEKNIMPAIASTKVNEEKIPKKKAESINQESSVAVVEKKQNSLGIKEDAKKQNEIKPVINNQANKPKENIPPVITSSKINEELKSKKKDAPLVTKEKKQNPIVIEETTKKENAVSPVINNKVKAPEKNVAPAVVSTTVNQQIKPKEEPTVVKKEEPPITIKKEEKNTVVVKEEAKKGNDLKPIPRTEKKEIPVSIAAANLSKREIETIRTVEISQDSLVFSLYDNGTVDGDTVSVLLNGNVIMPRVGLLERAINKTIYLTPEMGDSISVIMYAENLGSIPPNTGLLVIREAKRIYEIRFSGDLNKNSKIILIRKKKE